MSALTYFAVQRLRGGVHPDQIREARRLLDAGGATLAAHARSRLAAIHGPAAEQPAWLERQPLTLRTDLTEPHRQLLAGHPKHTEIRRTSGSTGTPFTFVKDKAMAAWMDATMWAAYSWHGVGPGDRRLRFWGLALKGKVRWRRQVADLLTRQIRLSAFQVTPADCQEFFLRARRFKARYAYGYPALMVLWADECAALGLDGRDLELHAVIATGELLPPETRRRLTEFFGCNVVNEYGCSESGVLAFECEAGTAHTTPVAALPEVIRPDGTVAGPGELGEVVVSDLYGRYLPMLRYRLHDLAVPTRQDTCRCGRVLPGLEISVGRQDSFIELADGRRIYDAILAYSVPAGVSGFRVFQRSSRRLEAQVTLARGVDREATLRALSRSWSAALGTGLELEIQVVESLPFEDSGKLRYFVPLRPRDVA
ncbi:MAG TPA: AMP-binding protein [Gemmatimonadales bacterium]